MQRRTVAKPSPKPDRKMRTILVAVLLLLLLSATVTWAMWNSEDPQVTKVRGMMAAMEELPREERREQFSKIREEADKLTEEQQDQLRDERRQVWEQREDQQMKEFFEMTPEEQVASLDKRIDEMQSWMKERAKRQGKEGGRGRGDRGGGRVRGQEFGQKGEGQNRSTERNLERLDRRSADSRARRDLYRRMMTDRMGQRGISFPGGGRRG